MIEQHELLGEGVRVGRDVAAVLQQRAVARPFPDVPKYLIERPVLADDVDDMLDEGRIAGTFGNRACHGFGTGGGRRGLRLPECEPVVLGD